MCRPTRIPLVQVTLLKIVVVLLLLLLRLLLGSLDQPLGTFWVHSCVQLQYMDTCMNFLLFTSTGILVFVRTYCSTNPPLCGRPRHRHGILLLVWKYWMSVYMGV